MFSLVPETSLSHVRVTSRCSSQQYVVLSLARDIRLLDQDVVPASNLYMCKPVWSYGNIPRITSCVDYPPLPSFDRHLCRKPPFLTLTNWHPTSDSDHDPNPDN